MRQSNFLSIAMHIVFLLAAFTLAAPRPWLATADTVSSTLPLDKRQSSGFWMETIQRQGSPAYNDDKSYKVFRNVKEYGAVGDGQADDTAAINRAISDGDRCGNSGTADCDSSTIEPAIVYFPAGTYKVSSSIIMLYYTQMIGDATNLPTIQGSADFSFNTANGGLALIDANPYIPAANGLGYYTNQNNFYRQIRNLIIDMTQMPESNPGGGNVNGLHWQVAQASSMQNVVFNMRPASATNKQQGIFMENGSVFNGGATGAFLGSQQFQTRNLTFNGCTTAIGLQWNWLWNFKSLNIQNCQVGLNMSTTNSSMETVGSAIVMDSKISASTAAIITTYKGADTVPETGSTLFIHNVDFAGSATAVLDGLTGNTVLAGNVKVAAWGQGNAYVPAGTNSPAKREPEPSPATCSDMEPVITTVTVSPLPASVTATGTTNGSVTFSLPSSSSTAARPSGNATAASAPNCSASPVIPAKSKILQQNMNAAPIPSSLLTSDGSVFERSKPQYIDVPKESFISVKTFGATGDGTTDDSDAVQRAMDTVTTDQILYFDHGAYVITKTVNVPANIRIVGEIWPLIMISGANFRDQNNPIPGFRVGQSGEKGNVEISDMMFETKGATPGAIMMEWNVEEASQGSAGMWDTHFRVGGSAGTELSQPQCDSRTSKTFRSECAASFLMMHITQSASAYFEATWFWVADHDLDLPRGPRLNANDTQISIFNGRGVLVESQGPVWLWGTSSEHSVLYNYQLNNARNVFMASIQTETAYMQPAPNALDSGFTPNTAWHDPDFSDCTTDDCKKTWGLRVLNSQDVFMYGGGMYSFFQDYNQDCTKTEDCQLNMVDIQCSTGIYLYGMTTKASVNQLTVKGQAAILHTDNVNNFGATVLLYQQE
ncbi:hypothetical protein LTR05_001447 [Lithohypha guttulata]|uniref:Rhamnogalacturonase A/B/Epimerase-like pectate lyase domain-containing protein n=1 Tax=Lithohypha guttulata TaxID=1690604 RepID=A0AAN7T983_9EURO|nr:hypothetical protein LTR05_001447 [Lithohypha guttulata]